MVVGGIGGTPGPVGLLHIQGNPSVASNPIIAAGFTRRVSKQCPASLYAGIACHAVNGNGVDYMVAPPGMVRG